MIVKGVHLHRVNDYNEMSSLLDIGRQRRVTKSTKMNNVSSRSHAIFTVHTSVFPFQTRPDYFVMTKLNMVDLAGSVCIVFGLTITGKICNIY